MPGRRALLQAGALAASGTANGRVSAAVAATRAQTSERTTLRVAIDSPETGFDPAHVTDAATNGILYHLYDAPLRFNPLARGAVLEPNTLTALPEPSADFRTWTLRFRPGIHFEPDAAFKGAPRELVAADQAFSVRRHFDPRSLGSGFSTLGQNPPVGLLALRKRALDDKTAFDYSTPVAGLQVLDRYTLRIVLERPDPRFDQLLWTPSAFAVAREVIERYGAASPAHPVGTGAFRVAHWTRSARVVLERRPGYREERIALPADPIDAALAARLQGRRLPLTERIEIVFVQEDQARWLAFLRGDLDLLQIPPGFGGQGAPGGQLAPYLARRGVKLSKTPTPILFYLSFNMEDPLVGGFEPQRIALRRAIGLSFDSADYIDSVLHGAGRVAHAPMTPVSTGFDPAFVSEMGAYDPTRARALLDVYGYVDRDGDGWRETPEGAPLLLDMLVAPGQRSRAINEQWRRYLKAVGLKVDFRVMQFPELLRNARSGRFMLVGGGYGAGGPDPHALMGLCYSGNINGLNRSRFHLPAYDRLFEAQARLPDGPERNAALREASRLLAVYMPIKCQYHQVASRLQHPWFDGPPARPFSYAVYSYTTLDADRALRGSA